MIFFLTILLKCLTMIVNAVALLVPSLQSKTSDVSESKSQKASM